MQAQMSSLLVERAHQMQRSRFAGAMQGLRKRPTCASRPRGCADHVQITYTEPACTQACQHVTEHTMLPDSCISG